jgi:hypothetical protein
MHDKYGYRNFIDGLCKIWNENKKPHKTSKIFTKVFYLRSGNTVQFNYMPLIMIDKLVRRLPNIRFYYSGAFYYGLAYTAFISLEFAIHDMLIEYISEFTDSKENKKDKSILEFLQIIPKSVENLDEDSGYHQNHWHNELISSFTAGAIGAFLTNGIEMVAVNKQANPSLRLKDILFFN